MTDIVAFSDKFGWLVALAVWLTVQGVTRIWPRWFSERSRIASSDRIERAEVAKSERVERAQEYGAVIAVYERFIKAQESTISFIAQCTTSLQNMERGLDANTREIEKLRECMQNEWARP